MGDNSFVDFVLEDDDVEKAGPRPPLQQEAPAASGNNRDELTAPVGRKLSEAEKKLKKFAKRMGFIDKIGNQVKAMTVAWASFVLLGAFSDNLAMRDFWFATIVLLRAKFSLLDHKYVIHVWGNYNSLSRQSSQETASRLFSRRRWMVMLVYCIELSFAILFLDHTILVPARALVAVGQDKNTAIARNKKYSLVLFYCLVILESLLFVGEDMYYIIQVLGRGVLWNMSRELGFGTDDQVPVQGFFVDCITSSSDAERDMVTFGVDLLASDFHDKHIVGVRILSNFANDCSRKVLINIGANLKALGALVGILDDEDVDHGTWISTATVLSRLTSVKENALRVDQIPGSTQIICYQLLQKAGKGDIGRDTARKQQLLSEVLANLAKEEDVKDRIGRTGSGGVVIKLLKIFFKVQGSRSSYDHDARDAAGDAIVMLTFQGRSNCQRILKLNLLKRFIKAAFFEEEQSRVFGLHAKKVLSNLCMYSTRGAISQEQLNEINTEAAPKVFKMIVDENVSIEEKGVIIGITAYTCKSEALEMLSVVSKVEESLLASKLVEILTNYKADPIIGRSVIEVVSWTMSKSHEMVHKFVEMNLKGILEGILEVADENEEESNDFELQVMVDTALSILNKQKQDCDICTKL